MPNIKPINTVYNGYRFRSRLEARWAVYFDLLHVKYEYESEGYVLENGITYLPDFYLPDVKAFFEVKPYHMETGDMSAARGKLELLAKAKDCFAMICRGDPVDNEIRIYIPIMGIWTSAEFLIGAEVLDDNLFDYYKAFDCGVVAGNRYSQDNIDCKTVNGDTSSNILPFNTVFSFDRIPYAEQKAARQARFEHGEC